MKAFLTIVFALTLTLVVVHSAHSKDAINQKVERESPCPSTNFEQFVQSATRRGENASKYAIGKIEVLNYGRVPLSALSKVGSPMPIFKRLNANLVDSKFHDVISVNSKSAGSDLTRIFESFVSELKPNLYGVKYGYDWTTNIWELLFERSQTCFRFVGWKSHDVPYGDYTLSYIPEYADSGLRLFRSLAEGFKIHNGDFESMPTKMVRYSRWEQNANLSEPRLVQRVYATPDLLNKVMRFPFEAPMDASKWTFWIDDSFKNEVAIHVQEKSLGVHPKQWKSVEYYFRPLGGIMYLTEIVDRHGMLSV
jgi:hypothetical protein